MLSLFEKSSVHLYKQLAFVFSTKGHFLVSVAMATDFEHKLNCADEFYKPVKFQANPLRAYPGITLYFSSVFGSAAVTSYLTSF